MSFNNLSVIGVVFSALSALFGERIRHTIAILAYSLQGHMLFCSDSRYGQRTEDLVRLIED